MKMGYDMGVNGAPRVVVKKEEPPWEAREGPTPWSGMVKDEGEKPSEETWLPQWDQVPEGKEGKRKARPFPEAKSREEERVERKVKSWWERLQSRVQRAAAGLEQEQEIDPRRRKRITPSNYSAMEIHGFFGLVDDGSCAQGRMLVCHVPSYVRGQFMDIKDGDQVHVWNVSGKGKGVLDVLFTGRHRYYSPGAKVTTCTICVPEEQWDRVVNWV